MPQQKHPRRLLVVIAEATIERLLTADAMRLGAHGYTAFDVRGAGTSGEREGAWEVDRTIQMEIVCETEAADRIAEHILATYAPNYHVTIFLADVQVLRPQKF